MVSTEEAINTSTFIITVYVGYFIVVVGLIGHVINILVFTQLKLFRGNQSAFYLTVASVFDCWQLMFLTTTRVTAVASGYDLTRVSPAWCKIRAYLTSLGAVILSTTICFSAIDQYLSTSYFLRVRQLSTYALAKRVVTGLVVFAILYAIPFPIFFEIHSYCGTFHMGFNYFYSIVHFFFITGMLPIVFSALFSFLAYQNVRRIVLRHIAVVRRRLDHQLTAMILVRVTLFVCTTIPYIALRIYQIYRPIDPNDSFANAVDQLIRTCFNTIYTIDISVVCRCPR
jgi:hypothetical protein